MGRVESDNADGTALKTKVSHLSGAVWTTTGLPDGTADTAIAVDNADTPHVCALQIDPTAMVVAMPNGSGWSIQTVDATNSAGLWCSIVVDSSRYAHVTYLAHEADFTVDLRYAFEDASGWHVEAVARYAQVTQAPLALDPIGNAHVVFADLSDNVFYASRDASGMWSTQFVARGAWPVLAIGVSGVPQVAYVRSDYKMGYATLSNGSWILRVADTDSILCCSTAIALSPAEKPIIVYRQYGQGPTRDHIKYAAQDDRGTWNVGYVNVDRQFVSAPSVAVDAHGVPHVSFMGMCDQTCDVFGESIVYATPPTGFVGT